MYARTHAFPIVALAPKLQAMYLGHILRANKDDPIRFVMLNDHLQPRQFYSVSPDKKGRPTPKWVDVVSNRPINTAILCTKAFIKKHPVLSKQPKNIQDLYQIAQARAAFRALAHSVEIQAQREQKMIDFVEPAELHL